MLALFWYASIFESTLLYVVIVNIRVNFIVAKCLSLDVFFAIYIMYLIRHGLSVHLHIRTIHVYDIPYYWEDKNFQ